MKKIGPNQGHLDNGPGLIKVVPVFVGQYVFSIYHWPTLISLTMYISLRAVIPKMLISERIYVVYSRSSN